MTELNFETIYGKYRSEYESMQVLYMVIAHNITLTELDKELNHKIKLAQVIRYPKKKKCVMDRLYSFKNILKEKQTITTPKINSIFFISEKCDEVFIDMANVKILKDYNVPNFIFTYGYTYDIDYLKNLLFDVICYPVISIRNSNNINKLMHYDMNATKKKHILTNETCDITFLDSYIKGIKSDVIVVHGNSQLIKNISKNDKLYTSDKPLKDSDIIRIIYNFQIKKNHTKLEEYLNYMTNEKLVKRLIFGSTDIKAKIESMEVKMLFCTAEKYKELIVKNYSVKKELLNFEMILIDRISNNSSNKDDLYLKFEKDYEGLLGVTYF